MKNKTGKMSTNTMFLIIFISIVLILEAVGGGIVYSAYAKEKRCSVMTEGVLIEWVMWKKKNKTTYYPVVEYTVGNETFKESPNVRTNLRPFKTGDSIAIGYNPSNPHDFYIEGYDLEVIRSLGGSFIIWGVVAVIINIICAILNRMDMDERRRVRIKERVFVVFFLLAFYWMLISFSSIKMAVFATVLLAPFVAYVKIKKWQREKEESEQGSSGM